MTMLPPLSMMLMTTDQLFLEASLSAAAMTARAPSMPIGGPYGGGVVCAPAGTAARRPRTSAPVSVFSISIRPPDDIRWPQHKSLAAGGKQGAGKRPGRQTGVKRHAPE